MEQNSSDEESLTAQRLRKHHLRLEDPSVLNLFFLLGLDGSIEIEALRKSLRSLVIRFPILGQFDPWQEEQFAFGTAPEESVDAAGARIAALLAVERTTPLDPIGQVFMRLRIIQFRFDQHLLLFSIHHEVADAYSLSLYARHLSEAYKAIVENVPPGSVPTASPTIAPAASDPRSVVEGRRAFRKGLEGLAITMVDPFSHVPKVEAGSPLHYMQSLDREAIDSIDRFCRAHRVTLFSLLAFAAAHVVMQAARLDRVVLGTSLSGRRTATDFKSGGALFCGSVLLINDPSLSGASNAVMDALERRISYEAQKYELAASLEFQDIEPAVFICADEHPLAKLQLAHAASSAIFAEHLIPERPLRSHSPWCGRICLHWRASSAGASLAVFFEDPLLDQALALHRGFLQHLERTVNTTFTYLTPRLWRPGLKTTLAPHAEAVSPVSVPKLRKP
jgi:hypothetical protein